MAVIRTTFQDTAALQAALDSADAAGANAIAVLNQGGGAFAEFANGFVITSRTNTQATGRVRGGGTFVLDGSGFLTPPATITHLRYNDNSPVATVDFFTNITVTAASVTGAINRILFKSANLDFDFRGSLNIRNPAVTRFSSFSVSIAGPTVVRSSFRGAVIVNNGVFSGTVTAASFEVDGQYFRATGLSNAPYSVMNSDDASLITSTLLSGNDTILGEGSNQTLDGFGGDDTITAGVGNDILNGGDGNDRLLGGLGQDTINGDAGDDQITMLVAAGQEDTIDAGADTDTLVLSGTVPGDQVVVVDLSSPIDQVVSIGGAPEALTQTNFENLNASGIGSSVTVTGSDGANVIIGSKGDDFIDGGAGNDRMTGRTGNDTYTVDSAGDVVTEALNAGTDKVFSSMTYALGLNVENLTLTGIDHLNGTGNTLANVLTGNDGNNVLTSGAGKDQLIGGDGNDTLLGGGGRDTVQGDAGDDVVWLGSPAQFAAGEIIDGGADTDTLRYTGNLAATLTLTNLVTDIEQVEIANAAGDASGIAAINVNAAAVANDLTINGNNGANVLTGTSQADTLTGNGGNDRLRGGLGSDTYQVNRGDGRDRISENDSTLGNSDTLLYGATITPLDLVLSRQVNDLRIALHGMTDNVTIQNWYTNSSNQVETIQAGNGQVLFNTKVQQLIDAMAQFTTDTGLSWDAAIAGGGTVQQQAQFQGILAASWQS